MSFALVQLVFAFVAGSQAMMGDSAAMIVDALTYLFNWIAERKKNRFDEQYVDDESRRRQDLVPSTDVYNDENAENGGDDATRTTSRVDPERELRMRERAKRKMVLELEIVPPAISVTTLLVVIAFVMRRAILILALDMHRSRAKQANPNINLMLAFSIFNLALDGLNVFCFAKAKHLFGYATDVHHHGHHDHVGDDTACCDAETPQPPTQSENGGRDHFVERERGSADGVDDEDPSHDPPVDQAVHVCNGNSAVGAVQTTTSYGRGGGDDDDDDEEESRANLNMCSAYTHVFADTLRSIAVIVAALIAEIVPEVTPEEADATAAVVVSILILLSLVPLFQGLLQSISELRSIRAEERSEAMFRIDDAGVNGMDHEIT